MPGLIGVHLYGSLNNTAEVFPLVVKDTLPQLMTGLTAAVVLGAAITTFNAGLNSSSTLFTLNLYKPWLESRNRQASEQKLVRTGKRFEIIISLLAMFTAPFILFANTGFYTYLQQLAGMFCVPVFTIVVMGFVTKKVSPLAAKSGIVFFIAAYIIFNYILNIKVHYLHMLAILFVLTSGCMLVVTKCFPGYLYTEEIVLQPLNLSPWKGRYVYFFILIVFMVALFLFFSKVGIA
jgi:SSS family solute:Na+ symporter